MGEKRTTNDKAYDDIRSKLDRREEVYVPRASLSLKRSISSCISVAWWFWVAMLSWETRREGSMRDRGTVYTRIRSMLVSESECRLCPTKMNNHHKNGSELQIYKRIRKVTKIRHYILIIWNIRESVVVNCSKALTNKILTIFLDKESQEG